MKNDPSPRREVDGGGGQEKNVPKACREVTFLKQRIANGIKTKPGYLLISELCRLFKCSFRKRRRAVDFLQRSAKLQGEGRRLGPQP